MWHVLCVVEMRIVVLSCTIKKNTHTHTHTHTHKTIIKNKRAIRLYASVGNKYDASCLPVATDDT